MPYVTLDVGTAERLAPGHEYLLLGQPVVQSGYVPLGLDTENDLRCQIPTDNTHSKAITIRCMLDAPLPAGTSLINGFAVFSPRRE